ncbi:MAG TPA: histidine kinase [Magnetospirillaceae bacterium]|nr:histidine kinase [Magnetospirillaceae bacterium]
MRKLPSWVWIASIWFAIGLFDATRTVIVMRAEGMQHDWPHLFVVLLLSWLVWTFLAISLVQRLESLRGWRLWLIHPLVCLAIGVISAACHSWLELVLNPWAVTETPAFLPLWKTHIQEDMSSSVILYATILAISFAWRSREQLARQRELLVQAQLDALRRQIEPHFLFNSLNAIVSLIREGRPSDAIDITVELGDLLRRLLDDSGRTLVPLFEEFDFLGKYLAIQKVRFGERLVIAIDRPDELAMAQVPALILQPLAENALKHGIGRRVEGGLLEIKVARDDRSLSIRVENDAPPLPPERQDGIGLSNIRARLFSLYGDQAALTIGAGAPGKVLVTLSLPYRPA